MVNISQKDFNLDMEYYLSKKQPPAKKKSSKMKKPVETTEESDFKEEAEEYYSSNKSFLNKVVDFITGEPSVVEKDEDVPEENSEVTVEDTNEEAEEKKKRGLFGALRGWLSPDFDVYENAEIKEEPLVNDDIKEILKIQNRWLSQLPAEKLRDFKKSGDYEVYRETLKKYKLIKE